MLINKDNLQILFDGFKGAFNKGFEGAESHYQKVAMVVPSSTETENYGWLGQFPKMREWIGDRVINNLVAHGFKVTNRDFEQTVGVPRNKIEDDQFGIFGPIFTEMGRAAKELPDELVFGLLAAGFASKCYDGQYFFDTDHPVEKEDGTTASVSNTQGGTGEAWFLLDTSKAIRPLLFQERRPLGELLSKTDPQDENVFWRKEYIYGSDGRCNAGYGLWQLAYASKLPLTAENYEAARAAMMTQKGDRGRPLNIKPDVLICGPNSEGAAMRLLNNGTRVMMVGAAPDTVPVAIQNEWAGTAQPIVTQWLDAA